MTSGKRCHPFALHCRHRISERARARTPLILSKNEPTIMSDNISRLLYGTLPTASDIIIRRRASQYLIPRPTLAAAV